MGIETFVLICVARSVNVLIGVECLALGNDFLRVWRFFMGRVRRRLCCFVSLRLFNAAAHGGLFLKPSRSRRCFTKNYE